MGEQPDRRGEDGDGEPGDELAMSTPRFAGRAGVIGAAQIGSGRDAVDEGTVRPGGGAVQTADPAQS